MHDDIKSKYTWVAEVWPLQLVLLHFETSLNDLQSFCTPNGNVRSDLLITTDTEASDGVPCWPRRGTLKVEWGCSVLIPYLIKNWKHQSGWLTSQLADTNTERINIWSAYNMISLSAFILTNVPLDVTGSCSEIWFKTRTALVSLSPLPPAEMFSTSLLTFIAFITFCSDILLFYTHYIR